MTKIQVNILLLLLIVFALFGCKKEEPIVEYPGESPESYSFFVAGHVYGSPTLNDTTLGLFEQFVDRFDYLQARPEVEFGVLTGDVVKRSVQPRWDSVAAQLDQLNMPLYLAPGNHEHWGYPFYESYFNSAYTFFEFEQDLFILLDPIDDSWIIPANQLNMVRTLVGGERKYQNIFVFFHQVLFYDPEPGGTFSRIVPNNRTQRADSINFWTVLDPIMDDLPSQIYYISGDVGAWCTGREAGIHTDGNRHFIYSGMGCLTRSNYLIFNVSQKKKVTFDLVSISTPDPAGLGTLEDYRF